MYSGAFPPVRSGLSVLAEVGRVRRSQVRLTSMWSFGGARMLGMAQLRSKGPWVDVTLSPIGTAYRMAFAVYNQTSTHLACA